MLDVIDDSRVRKQRSVLVDAQQSIAKRALDCRIFGLVKQSTLCHTQHADTIRHPLHEGLRDIVKSRTEIKRSRLV